MSLKSIINVALKKAFNVQIQRVSKPGMVMNTQNLLFEKDSFFNDTYDQGIKITGTPIDDPLKYFSKRRVRFYNTIQFYLQSTRLKGEMIECGCFRGLSSYMLCKYQQQIEPSFNGSNFTIVDSFEGLSNPTKEDALEIKGGEAKYALEGGHFATPMDHLKTVLKDFPGVKLVKGWIPEILSSLPEQQYKYVHIDLDLYEPIKGALEYFYPRMVPGGIIVFDDYGSIYWPGAKKAVDEFCAANNLQYLNITSAQAVIWKK